MIKYDESINIGQNKIEENVAGVGTWGGLCQCPDGQQYFVGDNNDACKSLACVGGMKISCNKKSDSKWKNRKVTCIGKDLGVLI